MIMPINQFLSQQVYSHIILSATVFSENSDLWHQCCANVSKQTRVSLGHEYQHTCAQTGALGLILQLLCCLRQGTGTCSRTPSALPPHLSPIRCHQASRGLQFLKRHQTCYSLGIRDGANLVLIFPLPTSEVRHCDYIHWPSP